MDVEFLGGRRKNASAVSTSLPKRLFLSGRNGRRSKPGSWTRAWCLVCESLRAAAVPVLVLRRPDVLHARREHHRRTEDSAASAGQRCGQRFVVGVRTTARRFFVFRRSLEQKQAPCVSRRRKKTAPVDRKLKTTSRNCNVKQKVPFAVVTWRPVWLETTTINVLLRQWFPVPKVEVNYPPGGNVWFFGG